MRNKVKRRLTLAFGIMAVMLALVVVCSGAASRTEAADFETRCGWLSNPTPANIWLNDRDGEWTIGVQGGYQVEGDWDWPKFKRGQWIETNSGGHGYGCACMQVRVDKSNNHVEEIKSAQARPLSACRNDPALKKIERTFK
jgi:hypothetical protein